MQPGHLRPYFRFASAAFRLLDAAAEIPEVAVLIVGLLLAAFAITRMAIFYRPGH
jgi:hypothetical protein